MKLGKKLANKDKIKVFILGASSDIGLGLMKLYSSEKKYELIAHYNKGTKNFFDYLKVNKNVKKIRFNFDNNFKKTEKFFKNKLLKNTSIFINASAFLENIKYEKITLEKLHKTLKINLFPGIMLTKIFGNQMEKNGWGRIVHLSSIGVKYGGGKGSFCYSLSKHGLEFFPSKVKEWAKKNVLVNTVRVGATNTKIHKKLPYKNLKKRAKLIPIKRFATINEIANYIYFLGSSKNTYITNEVISISGGE